MVKFLHEIQYLVKLNMIMFSLFRKGITFICEFKFMKRISSFLKMFLKSFDNP